MTIAATKKYVDDDYNYNDYNHNYNDYNHNHNDYNHNYDTTPKCDGSDRAAR